MKIKYALIALALSGMAGSAFGQANSPQAQGYGDRAARMLADGNFFANL